MNNELKGLLRTVADNDLKSAKQWAKIIVEKDKTQANKAFCKNIKTRLETSSMNFMELPYDIKELAHMENVAVSFNENRYYLTEREAKVFEEVNAMYETSMKLSEMGINYVNSLMLYGESGTGKTMFGKYIAYKLELPFMYMNFSNLISSYLGKTGQNISKVFDYATKQKCVLMLDEVDAIGMARGREDVGEMSRVTIGVMQALDCVKSDNIIIGATNRIDMIDKALIRRFTIQHEVKKFSVEETKEMIMKFLDDVDIKYEEDNLLEYSKTGKCSAEVINDVIRQVANSVRTGNKFVMEI